MITCAIKIWIMLILPFHVNCITRISLYKPLLTNDLLWKINEGTSISWPGFISTNYRNYISLKLEENYSRRLTRVIGFGNTHLAVLTHWTSCRLLVLTPSSTIFITFAHRRKNFLIRFTYPLPTSSDRSISNWGEIVKFPK